MDVLRKNPTTDVLNAEPGELVSDEPNQGEASESFLLLDVI